MKNDTLIESMLQKVQLLWRRVSDLGLRDSMPNSEKIRIKILNRGLVVAVMIQLVFLLKQLLIDNEWHTSPPYIVLFICGIALYLQYKGYTFGVKLFANLFFPVMMMFIMYLYGPGLRAEYAFFVLFVIAIILHREEWLQFTFLFYNVLMYLLGYYLGHYFDNPLASMATIEDGVMIFLASSICITLVVRVYYLENLRYENKTNQLLVSLEQKNDYLEKAYQELERFSYITSHDLKSPLRIIYSYSSLLEKNIKNNQSEQLLQHLSYIQQGTKQMDRVLNSIMDYTSIDQMEKQQPELVNLEALVHELLQSLSSKSKKPLEYSTDGLPAIRSFPKLWRKLLQLMLENSILYNESSPVIINLSHQVKDQQFLLNMRDNGIGIAPKYHERVFEMFERLHGGSRYQGTGLGLAICKKIVTKMGGDISLQSQTGAGAFFQISMPAFIIIASPNG